ncbi:DUF1254 domain-containing protein [Nocardia sp. SYP-A9097]|uniref:DUF1214 domain-containing protein n=1 Tax=Nocardia sp. SYP-A9097 TaxID=2663237 RepID=UPI00129A52E5|nr:DUF1214 domain-containing protein [Nocardia sp. SYP-A9097]MRH91552.1 DUF1254 domain-containing protein [Nocardia sp. SYP-A9097]
MTQSIPAAYLTPDVVDPPIGKLNFVDGAPTAETADAVLTHLDYLRGVDASLGAFRQASVYRLVQGLREFGTADNDVTIFSELMDATSLFLTANCDTVYFWSVLDLSAGPIVVDVPENVLMVFDDLRFEWITDAGTPGPDRGAGGRYLFYPKGFDGPLPTGGYFAFESATPQVMALGRAFLEDNDPAPAVRRVKDQLKITPYVPGGYDMMAPPAHIDRDSVHLAESTVALRLNGRTAMFYFATFVTPAMIITLPGIGSQYLCAYVDSNGEPFDGARSYTLTLPPGIPAQAFWSITLYDNQTRSMLATAQRFPRAGSQAYPTPAALPAADGSVTLVFAPELPDGVAQGNWIQTVPSKGWFPMLRLYSPTAAFLDKSWQPGEITPA